MTGDFVQTQGEALDLLRPLIAFRGRGSFFADYPQMKRANWWRNKMVPWGR